jgi:hypothetical protein
MSRKKIIIGVLAGFLAFAMSIDELFLGGGTAPTPLQWILMGPGLLGGPVLIWLMWIEYRKAKSSKWPTTPAP